MEAGGTGMSRALMLSSIAPADSVVAVRREIDRFVEAARKRSEHDPSQRRRSCRRYHRSWPLLVSLDRAPFEADERDDVNDEHADISVALHNGSELGIGFLSPQSMSIGAMVFIKLFAYDDGCPRVPAIVRHVTPTVHGYLVGCEFYSANEYACSRGLEFGSIVPDGQDE